MIFSSLTFFIFFAIVLLVLRLVKSNDIKKAFLLGASCFFYGYWDYRFLALMLVVTVANYFFGLRLQNETRPEARRGWLVASIFFNLAILGFFKYYNFFIESANAVLASAGIRFGLLNIILPIGISFITFEVISYTVDIYRKESPSVNSFFDLALLVAFFPHLIAGPILKPDHFLSQLDREITIRGENLNYGGQMFLVGLVKKVLVADRVAMFVDPVFKNPEFYSAGTLWLAVIAYAIQIYCDFSGYTDMAIGTARCMGFEIPQNFDLPYISRSITEFWRRWHISLSTWLRNYLYIPLGGNRKGKIRQYLNLLIVMLLAGLWHGASWNFVVWGGLHGIALAVHKVFSDYTKGLAAIASPVVAFISWAMTLLFVCTTWVFFRSSDFGTSFLILKKMFLLTEPDGIRWYATALFLALPMLIAADYAATRLNAGKMLCLKNFRGLFVLFFVLLGLVFLAPQNSAPFIYFQF
jgi:alginate O-acetyltransferase complex protein AlgI